jgi:hypothetical protein
MFGMYPYPILRAAFHPFRFGQGFATMLAIPNADSANPQTFAFISHETVGTGTVLANEAQQPVSIRLPQKPESVELGPDHWVLSDKTSTRKK